MSRPSLHIVDIANPGDDTTTKGKDMGLEGVGGSHPQSLHADVPMTGDDSHGAHAQRKELLAELPVGELASNTRMTDSGHKFIPTKEQQAADSKKWGDDTQTVANLFHDGDTLPPDLRNAYNKAKAEGPEALAEFSSELLVRARADQATTAGTGLEPGKNFELVGSHASEIHLQAPDPMGSAPQAADKDKPATNELSARTHGFKDLPPTVQTALALARASGGDKAVEALSQQILDLGNANAEHDGVAGLQRMLYKLGPPEGHVSPQ